MEKTSLREPIRSATFTGPSEGTVWPDSRPNLPSIATRFLDNSRHKKKQHIRDEALANRQTGLEMGPLKNLGSCSGSFPANDIVSFNHCGNSHTSIAVFHPALDSYYFAQGSDENLRTIRYLRGKRHCYVQMRTRLQILIYNKIEAAGGNIAGLSLLRIRQPFRRDPDD